MATITLSNFGLTIDDGETEKFSRDNVNKEQTIVATGSDYATIADAIHGGTSKINTGDYIGGYALPIRNITAELYNGRASAGSNCALCRVTFNLAYVDGETSEGGAQPVVTIYDVDAAKQTLDLRQHPRYNGSSTGYASPLTGGMTTAIATIALASIGAEPEKYHPTWQVWSALARISYAQTAGYAVTRGDYIEALLDLDRSAVGWALAKTPSADVAFVKDFMEHWFRGVRQYIDAVPVLRKTTLSYSAASADDIGMIGTPSGFPSAATGGWEFIKVGDRTSRSGRSGKWQRNEEWDGARKWLTTIYKSS